MKVVITSYGKDLTSKTDKSFGRAKWFVLVDTETGAFEAHSNEQNFNAAQGAGIQAAQNVSNLGAEAILTGNVGPNAFRTLSAASIKYLLSREMLRFSRPFPNGRKANFRRQANRRLKGIGPEFVCFDVYVDITYLIYVEGGYLYA